MGDYLGITSTGQYVIPCWNDNRTGIQQAYAVQFKAYLLVPQEYSDIASALSAAGSGQTVVVASGTYLISSNLNVPSGVTLLLTKGSTLQLASGVSISASGIINATGRSDAPITFTFSGTPGSISISGTGASNSTLSYCNIQNASPISVTNGANHVTINNCSITNSSSDGIDVNSCDWFLAQGNTITNSNFNHGIVIFGGSNDNCYDNTIYKTNHTMNGVGIYYTASSGRVARNDVEWYSWGLGANYGATPYSKGQYNNRNNRIANCIYGLLVYSNSNVYFGVASDASYNYNSIYNNFLDADTYNSSNITAHYDYWGAAPPVASEFYCGSGSSLDYGQNFGWWLSTDPWTGVPTHSTLPAQPPKVQPIASVSSAESSTGAPSYGTSPVEGPITADSLLQGILLRGDGKNKEAMDFFKSYLNRHPDNQVAYAYLYGCADSGTTPDIIQYFKSLPKQAAKENQLLLSYLYLRQGDVESAKQVNNTVMDANKNTYLEVWAKLNNFYIALYNENDPKTAATILNDLEGKANLFPQVGSLTTPMEISSAETALKYYVDPSTGSMPNANYSSHQSAFGSQQVQAGLMTNYPNPFNPTTVISYQLSVSGHVTLKVYDILGREVTTLVNENQSGGLHSVSFDASRLASGVYFYRLTAPGINQVKKMLLTK